MGFGEPAALRGAQGSADTVFLSPRSALPPLEEIHMASTFHRPLRARRAMAAWKLVMHQGLPIAAAADHMRTTPERVEYMLLALARRRATRLVG